MNQAPNRCAKVIQFPSRAVPFRPKEYRDPRAEENERYIELLDSVGNEPGTRAKLMVILEAAAAARVPP